MSEAAQKKEEHHWDIEEAKSSIMFGNCDGELKETFKNARKKLEIPMEAAMRGMLGTKKKSRVTDDETKGSNKILKTKQACIVEAHESTRKRLESSLTKDHEDHIAEKGFNSMSHCHLVHKTVPMPQAMKSPDAKASVDK